MALQQLIMAYADADAPLSGAGTIASLVCLVWFGSAAGWIVHGLVRRRRHYARFRALATERGFNVEAAYDLWLLAAHSGSRDRAVILTSARVFDSCVEEARAEAGDDLTAWPERLSASRVATLRKHYETVRKARGKITSTFEMELNQPVSVRLEDGQTFNSFVLRVTDERLHMAAPGQDELRRRLTLCKSFTAIFTRPNDARYEFSSEVVDEPHVSATEFLGTHSDVKRTQARASARVRCKSETRFCVTDRATAAASAETRSWKLPKLDCTATLRDLSLGGACLVSRSSLPEKTWMLLNVSCPRGDETLTLPARVVRSSELKGTSNTHAQICVRFGPLTSQQENRMARLMADLQQKRIRRMLSRAGAPEDDSPWTRRAPMSMAPASAAASQRAEGVGQARTDVGTEQERPSHKTPLMQNV